MPGPQLCYARRQRAEPFRPAPRPPPLMGRLLSRASPAQKAPLLGVTPRCAGRCRGATEGFGSEGLAELARPEGSRRALRGRPSTGIHPLTPAAAWGQAALRFSWKMCAGSRGVGNAAPYSCNFFSNFCLTTALYHAILLVLVKANRSKYPTFGTTIARPVRFSPRAGRFYGAES